MPRVYKLARDPRQEEILKEIGGIMAVMKVSRAELARLAGINPSTMAAHMKDIGSMRLSELWAIQDVGKRGMV